MAKFCSAQNHSGQQIAQAGWDMQALKHHHDADRDGQKQDDLGEIFHHMRCVEPASRPARPLSTGYWRSIPAWPDRGGSTLRARCIARVAKQPARNGP